MNRCLFFLFISLHCIHVMAQNGSETFRNAQLPLQARVNDLLQRLTTEEKISLLGYNSTSIDRLGIPAYNWWNEALHGVARAGRATVFPQAIGMAASFNDSLLHEKNKIANSSRKRFLTGFIP